MVMDLAVEKRDPKRGAKALRRDGLLPAVVYGRDTAATPITVDQKKFEKLFHEAGESTVITLKGLGDEKDALIHEVAVDPVSGQPLHADFYAIQKGQKVTVAVPLEFEGESEAVKTLGGILTKIMHEIEIECEPKDLPHAIVVDISKLATLEDQIHVSDLALPASATTDADPEDVVAMISVAEEEPVEEAPVDLSSIEISEERGKKEEDEGGDAAPAEQPEKKE